MTPERFAKAPNLKLCATAGTGSDHIDLDAAAQRGGKQAPCERPR